MLFLLALACHVHEDSDCVEEVREVDDDEVLGDLGVTAAGLAAEVGGIHSLDVTDRGGATTGATFTVARGDAPAVLHDAERHATIKTGDRFVGFGTHMPEVVCEDTAEVPLAVTVSIGEAGVTVTGTALAEAALDSDPFLEGRVDDAGTITPLDQGDGDGRISAVFEAGAPVSFALTLADDRTWSLAAAP